VTLAQNSKLSVEQFLQWRNTQPADQRYELLAGEPVAMAPERNRHNLVKLDCAVALREAVKKSKSPCTVFGDGASIIIDETTLYEPDVTVQCNHSIDLDAVTVSEPMIVVEVLSPSTHGIDTGRKLIGYFELPSIIHYLVVDPGTKVATHHYRANNQIITRLVKHGRISMEPPGIEFELEEMFLSLPQT